MSFRVAHLSDPHLTEGGRFFDTLRCLDAFVDDGIAQGVGLWTLTGDMTGIPAPHTATRAERLALAVRLQRMANHAPVVLIRGNHDAESDLLVYGRLSAAHPILVYEEPEVVDVAGARVFCFPYPFKAHWLAAHLNLSMDAQNRAIEADLQALLGRWRPQVAAARAAGMPTLFLGHVAIQGSLLAGGERQLPPGEEIEITVGDLQALGCDYSGNGHIHLGQELAPGIWNVGSPDRSNFGEETDVKGWNVVDLVPGLPARVHRRLSPTRRYQTLDVTWALDAGTGAPGWVWQVPPEDLAGVEVRVRVAIPEEASATAPVDALEAHLRTLGAFDVAVTRRAILRQELRCAAVVQAATLADQLVAFWEAQDDGPAAEQRGRCLAKLPRLDDDEMECAA